MKETLVFISREEFIRRFRSDGPVGITISTNEGDSFIPVPPNLIVCDFCNDEITGEVAIYAESNALCPKCSKRIAQSLIRSTGNPESDEDSDQEG